MVIRRGVLLMGSCETDSLQGNALPGHAKGWHTIIYIYICTLATTPFRGLCFALPVA